MSSSGVRESDSIDKRTKKLALDREEDLINSFKTWDEVTSLSSLAGGGTQASGQGTASGNFMQRSGDTWLGQYGNQFEIITIQNGQLNVSRQSGASSPILVVNPESGSPDFLDKMIPGTDILFYQEQLIHTVNQPITIRPILSIPIINIVGNGGNIVVVTVADTSKLTNNDKVTISNTTNFDLIDAIITVSSGTQFTYDLGTTASTTPETSGDVNRGNIETQNGENLVCPVNTIVHFIFNTVTQVFQIDAATIIATGLDNVPDPTAQFQHLQSDGANNWIAQQELQFGIQSADAGQLRFPNDTIGMAWRNAADDGNIELGVNSSDILDITISGQQIISFSTSKIELNKDLDINTFNVLNVDELRFQNAGQLIEPTPGGLIYRVPLGDGHLFSVDGGTKLNVDISDAKFFIDISLDGNSLILDINRDTEINSFSDDSMQFLTGGQIRATLDNNALLTTVPINMLGLNKIINVLNPVFPQDVVTKAFADATYFTNPANTDLDMNTFDITNIDSLFFVNTIQEIKSTVAGLDFKVDALQDYTFRSPNGDFLALTEVNATDRRLDIKQNRIVNTAKYMFSPVDDLETALTAEIFETLTTNDLLYKSNAAHVFRGGGSGTTLLSIGNFAGQGGFVQDIALLNFNSLTGEFLIFNGDFQLDGNDMKVMSGGQIRNLSDIVAGSSSPLTTKGDIFVFSTVDARLPVGTNGQILSADSSEALGVKWVTGGGASEIPVWTQPHDADGFDFILTQDGFGSIKTDRNVSIPSETIFFFVNNAGSERSVMVFDNPNTEVRINSPFNLNPSSSGSQTLGVDSDRWDQAFIDSFIDFDDSGVPTNPGIGEGRIFWEQSTKSFHQIDDAGINTDLSSASAGANQQLTNLSGIVRPNLNILANRSSGGVIGGDNATDSFFNIWTDRISFANQTSIPLDKHAIGRETTSNNFVFNAPVNEEHVFRINGFDQFTITSSVVDLKGNDMIDVGNIGTSGIPVDNFFSEIIRFPINNIGVANNHTLYRNLISGTEATILNVPTDKDFFLTQNDEFTDALFHIDTSSLLINIGKNGSIQGINLNDNKSIGFATGQPFTFNSNNGIEYNAGTTQQHIFNDEVQVNDILRMKSDIKFDLFPATIDFQNITDDAISGGTGVNVPNTPFTYIKIKILGGNFVIPVFQES